MTMDGKTNDTKDAIPVTTGQPSSESGSNPSNPVPPKTYTEAEVNQRHSKLDKTISTLTSEKESLESQIATLSAQIDELTKDEPEKKNWASKHKEATALLKTAEAKLKDVETREAVVHEAALAKNATTIAAEYQENKPERLIKACQAHGIKHDDEAGIRKEATDILGWTLVAKQEPEKKNNPPAADSGIGSGGGGKPSDNDAHGLIEHGLKNWK